MTLDDMVQDVMLDVPEAPMMTVRAALAWAARQFCTDADAWVVEGEPVVVAANTDYPEVIGSGEGEPLRIRYLIIDGTQRRSGFEQTGPAGIRFEREPKSSVLYGAIACRPAINKMPPESVCKRWGEAFCNGARYRLLSMPQPWRNPESAAHYMRLFKQAKSNAKQAACLGHQSGGARVKPRRFI